MWPAPPCSAPLAGGGCEHLRYFSAGIAVRHIICEFYLFIYFSSQLCCPLRFQNSPTYPLVRGFPGVWILLLFYDSLPWISVPNSLVSLFIFYILSYLLLKTMGCLSGCLMSSASVQKVFCGIYSVFKCSFNEYVGVGGGKWFSHLIPLPS